jgi:hypothetical protein
LRGCACDLASFVRASRSAFRSLAALDGRANARVRKVLADACAESLAREVAFEQSEVSIHLTTASTTPTRAVGEPLGFAGFLGRRCAALSSK